MNDQDKPIVRPIVENLLIGAGQPGIGLVFLLKCVLGFMLFLILCIGNEAHTYYQKFPSDMWLRFFIEDATPSGRRRQYLDKIETEKNRRARPTPNLEEV